MRAVRHGRPSVLSQECGPHSCQFLLKSRPLVYEIRRTHVCFCAAMFFLRYRFAFTWQRVFPGSFNCPTFRFRFKCAGKPKAPAREIALPELVSHEPKRTAPRSMTTPNPSTLGSEKPRESHSQKVGVPVGTPPPVSRKTTQPRNPIDALLAPKKRRTRYRLTRTQVNRSLL